MELILRQFMERGYEVVEARRVLLRSYCEDSQARVNLHANIISALATHVTNAARSTFAAALGH